VNKPEPILLSPPHLGTDELRFVQEAFDTNWIAPVGPHIDHFERELAEVAGVRSACALSSGTAAIHLGLILLGVKPGDLVLCSSLTFVASANPIRYCGAEPIFVDVDPDTWCMSVPALERTLERLAAEGRVPRACVAVSLYGQAADMPAICKACARHGVKVLDEAAEALGATHGKKMAGTFGDLGVYSFNGNKIITTSGGGALLSENPEYVERARHLATQAREPSDIGAYEHTTTGFNHRMSNVLAGIGRGQLRVLEDRINRRRSVFDHYQQRLGEIDGISWMPEAGYGRSTRWLTCGLLADETLRDRLMKDFHDSNIDARPTWKPMHLQPVFEGCEYECHQPGQDISAGIFRHGFCLPSGSNLQMEQLDRVIAVLIERLG
jgi:dTDP-4-amino-4,6-dideoxygalactose transaminase